ncbi:MAG: hypothetical protein HN405_09410, partial [Planctomycetes bacterium]|nr:hypothetical protein [Planctomycetota bacterium]
AKRQVDWHDLTRSLDCGFALWQHWLRRPSPAFLLKQVIDAVRHTRFFAKRFTNAGAASDFLAMLGRSTQMPIAGHQEIVGHQGRGFSPLQGRSFDEQALSRFASLQTKRRKSEMLATAMPASAKSPSAPIELERVVARLEASAAQKGVSILWFIHAGAGESDWHSLQQQGVIQHLIDFSDPTLSSEWYGEEFRYDYGHLNWEGAKKMTSIVARKIHSLDSSN